MKYSFDRVIDPAKKSPQYGNVRAIKEVKVVDAETVHIITDKPFPLLLERLVFFPIVNKKHVEAVGDQAFGTTSPVGTGPWKFKQWVRGSHLEFVRNESYWRPGLPYMDRLILRYIREAAGRAAAMEAGEIQIGVLNPVALTDIKRLTSTAKCVATSQGYEDSVWATTLECNCRKPLFAKREVRQAMFHAIDRGLIAPNDGYADAAQVSLKYLAPGVPAVAYRNNYATPVCTMRYGVLSGGAWRTNVIEQI